MIQIIINSYIKHSSPGAKVNTVVTSAGGYFTNEEIEQVQIMFH